MMPAVLARQVQRGVVDFLATTFPITGGFFTNTEGQTVVEALVGAQVFKGPYVSVALPYQTAAVEGEPFADVPLGYRPYAHQAQAFARLRGPNPQNTLIATGTGSGKTECFQLPILETCLQQAHKPGIKALLIYPMNALATDQAARLAGAIWNNPKLNGQVTAGIYVGGEAGQRTMTATELISDRDTLRLKPPDILITNYKMLDYLLLRAEDLNLWSDNDPDTLRYLVVDELHSFDGAQGTDLACLIRRLKARLKIPAGQLCCVGTSATLGVEEGPEALVAYAGEVFGEPFAVDGVIGETREAVTSFCSEASFYQVPPAGADLDPMHAHSPITYLASQVPLWFPANEADAILQDLGSKKVLGQKLRRHRLLEKLLAACGHQPRAMDRLIAALWPDQPELRARGEALLTSFLSLISAARGPDGRPFLQVRLQAWMRELTRLVCSVRHQPKLTFADDLPESARGNHLPLIHCRDCGAAGWVGVKGERDPCVRGDLQTIYQSFFAGDPKLSFLFPDPDGQLDSRWRQNLCGQCLHVQATDAGSICARCGDGALIPVFKPSIRRKKVSESGNYHVADRGCPVCLSDTQLNLVGSRAASLISVQISQLFSSTFNTDKKLLTFSDAVQDAAHRAAFFAARTFRFNLRGAIQQVVDGVGAGQELDQFAGTFIDHWREQLGLPAFMAGFLPPNVLWRQDVQEWLGGGEPAQSEELVKGICRRLHWEILSEYGFRARLGRTLEKSGASIAQPDEALLGQALALALPVLQNECGGLRELEALAVKRTLLGLLERGRVQGAIYFDGLHSYVTSANSYMLNRIWWLPGFGAQRAPKFWMRQAPGRFESLIGKRNRVTWVQSYVHKTLFAHAAMADDQIIIAIDALFKAMTQAGLLKLKALKGDDVWAIAAPALRVGARVAALRCATCGHQHWCGEAYGADWQGAPCLRQSCGHGTYRMVTQTDNYYADLYRRGQIQRIYAAEHTGLLQRDEREHLERRFKAEGEARQPWFPNLLSCTPTLEMGIDIGDLSSLILCSVPPNQANYLQRIGRAGRKDGNALTLTLANGRNHDQYFFAEPEAMIAGHVTTPGVFLEAATVLERQLIAFSLDCWVAENRQPIPPRLATVLNTVKAAGDPHRFPHNWLRAVKANADNWLAAFCRQFPSMSEATKLHLHQFLHGEAEAMGRFDYRVLNGLHLANKELAALNARITQLDKQKTKLQQNPARDDAVMRELEELRRELAGLRAIAKGIRGRQTLQYFADEGLLPNYAFPEAGVLLRSVIHRKRNRAQDDDGRPYDTFTYEYERPSAAALVELAPESAFYAGGRKVRISRIDLRQSKIEMWRFCDRCNFSMREGEQDQSKTCPECHSTFWSDQGQKRAMVRLQAVYAASSARDAQLVDDSDERDHMFFLRETLVQVAPGDIATAYKLESEEMPFGFEYVKRAQFRDINFGKKSPLAPEVAIAGKKLARGGFRICTKCGAVVGKKAKDKDHAFGCPGREDGGEVKYSDCVYLYREFASEAIRMLLPVTSFAGSERKLQSFVAALQLGLKRKFAGNIDHLQTCKQEEPVLGENYRKTYLVLFDRVPGGTGYLKQLTKDRGGLLEVLALALDHLKACACHQDPDKDGCYRCLFAYRSSYHMTETSRDEAIAMLSDMVRLKDRVVPVANLRAVTVSAVHESELEARFIEALKLSGGDVPVTVRKEVVGGKPGQYLKVGDHHYLIEAQVGLGAKEGVRHPSRADFVIWPQPARADVKPLAIFVDGYTYHRDILGADLAKRMALNASGGFRVWSLNWQDIQASFSSEKRQPGENLFEPCLGRWKAYLKDERTTNRLRGLVEGNSFDWLLRLLAQPGDAAWQKTAAAHFGSFLEPEKRSNSQWWEAHRVRFPAPLIAAMQAGQMTQLAGDYPSKGDQAYQLSVSVDQASLKMADAAGFRVLLWVDDRDDKRQTERFRDTWQLVLRGYNLAQFIPHTAFVCSRGVADGLFDDWAVAPPLEVGLPVQTEDWAELLEEIDEAVLGLGQALANAAAILPECPFELAVDGRVVAQAAMAWPSQRVAVLTAAELTWRDAFVADGWRCFETDAAPEVLVTALGNADVGEGGES